MNTNIIKAWAVAGVLAFTGLIFGMNSYTIVQEGTTKVETTMGVINPVPLKEGVHFVKFWSSFDEIEIRNNKYVFENMLIPTQDRFNSTANVTVLFRIDESKTPSIKRDYGSVEQFIDRALSQYLINAIKDEGRKIPDSRGLADSKYVTDMQVNTQARLEEVLKGTGIKLQQILVQDVKFDSRIQDQILRTQDRIQKEEEQKSQLRIEKTNADKVIAAAYGDAESSKKRSEASAYSVTSKADADAHSVKVNADAQRYSIEQQAIANEKLTKSLTPEIMKLEELKVRQVEAGEGWKGVFGDNMTIVVGDGKTAPNVPLLFKNLQNK